MSDDIELAAALHAFRRGRAVRIASHARIHIQDHALIICPIRMAGEDATLHCVAVGHIGNPPIVLSTPDPRMWSEQQQLLSDLSQEVASYFSACRASGAFPQIWVPSQAAVVLIDTLAEHLRVRRADGRTASEAELEAAEATRRLGELLTYSADRSPIAGQQAFIAATTALRMHWKTGQQPSADEHLGVLLAWIRGNDDIRALLPEIERMPMSIVNDSELDRRVLEPLVHQYANAKRNNAGPSAMNGIRRAIHEALRPAVIRQYGAVSEAIALLRDASWEPLPDLVRFAELEKRAFGNFMNLLASGVRFSVRDSPAVAAFKIEEREHAAQTYEAALRIGDEIVRAKAVMSGHIVRAFVSEVRPYRTGTFQVVLGSNQPKLRVRQRDTLYAVNDLYKPFKVEDVATKDDITYIRTEFFPDENAGHDWLRRGVLLDLVENAPDWAGFERIRQKIARRINPPPWTHGGATPPPQRATLPGPADPLAAVEQLRA